MPKFSANLSMMFNEVPFLDRFAAARDAGFKAVEYLFPYDYAPEVIAERLAACGLENNLFNMPPGNWAAGERGITCIPGREEEFRAGVEKAILYATRLGVKRVHAMAGVPPAGSDPAACKATMIANLKYAAEQLAQHGITLLVEAINHRDIPGFFISRQSETFELLQAVAAPNFKMQIDCYHMQIMEGDLSMNLKRYMPHCGHVQIAGVPGRNEPDTGEVRYENIFRLLDELGYTGWVGCEYKPLGKTVDGLGWFRRMTAVA